MVIGYETKTVTGAVVNASGFTIPAEATSVTYQVLNNGVFYISDGVISPATNGFYILDGDAPREMSITDFRNTRWVQKGGNGILNIHYHAGRDI